MKSVLLASSKTPATKRTVLQAIAGIFHPLGLICPFVIKGKILFQQLWIQKICWDVPLANNLKSEWNDWIHSLPKLQETRVKRYLLSDAENRSDCWDVHIFCDASPQAYGAVAYLRFVNSAGGTETSFLSSKTRVAPIRKLTVPRLELMGVLIAARMGAYLKNKVFGRRAVITFWTDSSIALG